MHKLTLTPRRYIIVGWRKGKIFSVTLAMRLTHVHPKAKEREGGKGGRKCITVHKPTHTLQKVSVSWREK